MWFFEKIAGFLAGPNFSGQKWNHRPFLVVGCVLNEIQDQKFSMLTPLNSELKFSLALSSDTIYTQNYTLIIGEITFI